MELSCGSSFEILPKRAKSIKFQLNDLGIFLRLLKFFFSVFFSGSTRTALYRAASIKFQERKKSFQKNRSRKSTADERGLLGSDYLRTEISITVVINVKCKHFVCGKVINYSRKIL